MKNIIYSTLFVLYILFTGCNKCEPKNETGGMIKSDAIVRVITTKVNGPQFINSANEFNAPIEVSFDDGVTYEAVDFSKYSVFALPTTASCSSGYNRNVSKNDVGQTVTYSITIIILSERARAKHSSYFFTLFSRFLSPRSFFQRFWRLFLY